MLKALALDSFWSPFLPKTKKANFKIAKKSGSEASRFVMAAVLIAANALLLMGYIYGVNESASSGYEIKTLQNKLSDLSADNKKLNLKVAEASSMVSIQNDFLSANFVPSGTSKYLQVNQFSER